MFHFRQWLEEGVGYGEAHLAELPGRRLVDRHQPSNRRSRFRDQNVLAAMSFLVALPTIIVYIVLSKQFVRGLTLGSTKG